MTVEIMGTYGQVYNKIASWIENDKVLKEYISEIDPFVFTELDFLIFDLFNIEQMPENVTPTANGWWHAHTFNRAVANASLDVNWLFSPNGLTLFKALLIRHGKLK